MKNPLFAPGSLSWYSLRKWGYFFNMFFSIANPDGYNLFLTPLQFIEHQNNDPRLMAILLCIQKLVRSKIAKDRTKPTKRKRGIKKI